MFNFDLNKIRILGLELNSYCNLTCGYCPRITYDFPQIKEYMKNDFIDFITYNIINNSNSIEWIELNGYNQVFTTKEEIDKLNLIIERIKTLSNKNIKFKVCSNGTKTKEMDFYDVLNLNVEVMYFTKHRKNDFWINDLLDYLNKNNIKYNVYIHKEHIDKQIIEFNNKLFVFLSDASELSEENKEHWNKIIENHTCGDNCGCGYRIYNIGNNCKYLKKSPKTKFLDTCPFDYPLIDYMGYIFPCYTRHHLFKENLEYGHLERIDGKVKYIENKNIDWTWCEDCQNSEDCDPDTNLNKYFKVEI